MDGLYFAKKLKNMFNILKSFLKIAFLLYITKKY